MGNRIVGDSYVLAPRKASFTTFFNIDLYNVAAPSGSPVTVTLDPGAVDGDIVAIQDVADNAGTQPITIEASEGQTILNGIGSSMQLATSGGRVTLTYSALNSGWIAIVTSATTSSGGGNPWVTTPSSWSVANWYVNPVTGLDSNSGTSPSSPVKTIMGGIVSKWETPTPILKQVTVIHMLATETQSQEDIVLQPVFAEGGMLGIDCSSAWTLAATFTLGTVTELVRTDGGTLWAITGFTQGSIAVGQVLVNSVTGGYALITNVEESQATIDQPLLLTLPPTTSDIEDTGFATGQSVSVYSLPLLNLKSFGAYGGDESTNFTGGVLWVNGAMLPDVSGSPGSSTFSPGVNLCYSVQFQSCVFQPYVTTNAGTLNASSYFFLNCSFPGGAEIETGTVLGGDSEFLLLGNLSCVDMDHYALGGLTTRPSSGTVQVGYCFANGPYTIEVYPGVTMMLVSLNGLSGAALYGSANLSITGNGAFVNRSGGTWATSLLLTGTLSMDSPTGLIATAWSPPATGTFTLNGQTEVQVTGVNGTNAFPSNAGISFALHNANGGTIGVTGPQFAAAQSNNNFFIKGSESDTSIYDWTAGPAPGVAITAANLDIYSGLFEPHTGARMGLSTTQ